MAYNTQEERLKVKGSEQITRDLKVNRDLFVTGEAKVGGNDVLTTADRTNDVVENSVDVLTSGGAYTALETKQDVLTFDDVPTQNSDNPVKSGGVYDALATKINLTEKGASNGVATLDATGRVPYSQLPESAMEYQGTWDASTNTPTLADGVGTNGDFYVVSAGGTVNFGTAASPRNVTFYVNDRVIYDGNTHQWARLPAGEVRSVNGHSGDVVLTASDVGAATSTDITNAINTEVTNRNTAITNAINALDVASAGGAGKYISAISETNGKISATATTMDTAPTASSTNAVTSGGVKTAIDNEATARNTAITNAINALDVTDTAVSGKYVSAVSETNGKISVTRADLPNTINNAKSLNGYVTCTTAAGTAAKTVDLPDFTLVKGAKLIVYVQNANTAASALTLNVNSTGAKTIKVNGTTTSSSSYSLTAQYYNCYYDGTNWCMNTYEANSAVVSASCSGNASTADYTRGTAYCSTAAGTAAKVVNMRGYVLATGGAFPITFANANSAASKLTLNINSKGAKDLWINGAVTSATNYTLPAGTYMCYYDGNNYYIDTANTVYSARTLQGMTPTEAISNNTIGMRNSEGNMFANNINMRVNQGFTFSQSPTSTIIYYCYNDWNTIYFSIGVDVYLSTLGYIIVGEPNVPSHWGINAEYAPLNISFKPSSSAQQLSFRHLSAIWARGSGGVIINYNTNNMAGNYALIISGMLPMSYY